ncbi:MAG: GntR family transcriptional regulator [Nakamurella sp.]
MVYKYEVISEQLIKRIGETLGPHDALPPERELAEEYGVSRMTVRAAIAKLTEQSRVYQVHGSGTFVASMDVSKAPRLTSFTEDMVSRGFDPSSSVLGAWTEPSSPEVAERLKIEPGTQCMRLKRLRLADGRPMALEETRIPQSLFSLAQLDLGRSLYEQLTEAGLDLYRAEQEIRSVSLTAADSKLLQVDVGAPALCVERLGCSRRGSPIELAQTLYRSDRYSFRFPITRDGNEK